MKLKELLTEKKNITIIVMATLLLLVAAVGASYAYFAVTTKTSGNDHDINIVTEDLGSIKWQGTKVYTSGDLLPGECGIQTFTIEKNSQTGKGVYEIDLKGDIDEAFGTDVEITLYKSTDTANDYVSITEGSSVIEGTDTKIYYKEDTVNTIGNVTKVYGATPLESKNGIILEQVDFDNANLQKTTYYLVYCYKNNGNQDNQQGKSFSGEIKVRLILEKGLDDGNSSFASVITELAQKDTATLSMDVAQNTRYVGYNPNNYVYFNCDDYTNQTADTCELWRIMGVMNDTDEKSDTPEVRQTANTNSIGLVKIIRNDPIDGLNFTSKMDDTWQDSSFYKYLNEDYYYGKESNADKGSTLKNNITRNAIANSKWYTNYVSYKYVTNEDYANIASTYLSERGLEDDSDGQKTIYAKIGLPYLSDIAYSVGNETGSTSESTDETTNETTGESENSVKNTCLKMNFNDWKKNSICKSNNYLLYNQRNSGDLMAMTGGTYSEYGTFFYINMYEELNSFSNGIIKIKPTLHLKSSVKIIGGTGTKNSPYKLAL